MTMTRMKGIDPAMIDREVLPHLEMGTEVRPHRHGSVTQRDHKIEGLDVADELQGPNNGLQANTGMTLSRWAM